MFFGVQSSGQQTNWAAVSFAKKWVTGRQNFGLGLGLDLEIVYFVSHLTVVPLACHPDDWQPNISYSFLHPKNLTFGSSYRTSSNNITLNCGGVLEAPNF